MCVGGIRMSTIATSGRVRATARSSSPASPALPDDLDPGLGRAAARALRAGAPRRRRSRRAWQLRAESRPGRPAGARRARRRGPRSRRAHRRCARAGCSSRSEPRAVRRTCDAAARRRPCRSVSATTNRRRTRPPGRSALRGACRPDRGRRSASASTRRREPAVGQRQPDGCRARSRAGPRGRRAPRPARRRVRQARGRLGARRAGARARARRGAAAPRRAGRARAGGARRRRPRRCGRGRPQVARAARGSRPAGARVRAPAGRRASPRRRARVVEQAGPVESRRATRPRADDGAVPCVIASSCPPHRRTCRLRSGTPAERRIAEPLASACSGVRAPGLTEVDREPRDRHASAASAQPSASDSERDAPRVAAWASQSSRLDSAPCSSEYA